ncbi:MAG TPA: hypothetical protein VFX96_04950, partial [Pyrinomonadaceae bacterium]|nr:hypothetical protein [Pyrinomonadaceae bacterium]
LAGNSGPWPSFSRERAYTSQVADGSVAVDDTSHAYTHAPSSASRVAPGADEVAWTAPRYECSSQPSRQLAGGELDGRSRVASNARAELKVRAAQGKSLARVFKVSRGANETAARVVEVGRKSDKESLGGGVEVVAGVAASARLKVVTLVLLPEVAYRVRAAWSATRTTVAESARHGAGSPLKCLRESGPPEASKSVVPTYMTNEMLQRREPSVYIVPLLDVLDIVVGAETPKAEDAEASVPAVSRPDCTGKEEALTSESPESPGEEHEVNTGTIPRDASTDAETPKED